MFFSFYDNVTSLVHAPLTDVTASQVERTFRPHPYKTTLREKKHKKKKKSEYNALLSN